ncbi:MAG: dehydratase [Chloroflexi bacterium RBG_13_56_8]|nr:MAG: dehydratase [Chloroflexi bacterium RBG_13_56_8]
MSASRPKGLYFEEFALDQEMESPSHTVTEEDVIQFAELSGDHNPMHTDAEFARQTPFGQRIAHGLLGLSMASGLAWGTGFIEGTVEAFTGLTWKFRAPVFLGDSIRVRVKVEKLRPMPSMEGGIVVFDARLLNQHDKVVQQGEWTMIIRGRPKQ